MATKQGKQEIPDEIEVEIHEQVGEEVNRWDLIHRGEQQPSEEISNK